MFDIKVNGKNVEVPKSVIMAMIEEIGVGALVEIATSKAVFWKQEQREAIASVMDEEKLYSDTTAGVFGASAILKELSNFIAECEVF